MNDYDIILGMDWLSKYCATIDCQKKIVILQPPREEPFIFARIMKNFRFPLISALKAQHWLEANCEGYLVSDISIEEQHHPTFKEVPVVQEYPEVFSDDLIGLPPDREIEFIIDVQ